RRGTKLCRDLAHRKRTVPACCLSTGQEDVFGMGGRRRCAPAAVGPCVLAYDCGRSAAAASGLVFAAHGVLLLAVLEWRETICAVGSSGAWYRQWLSPRPDRVSLSPLADRGLGRHEV